MASPVGMQIGRGHNKFIVGEKIGSGACATVYELKDKNDQPTKFAVKITPLPKKVTKKQNSPEETNARLLFYEQLVYNNHFGSLQGKVIPSLPGSNKADPPVYGEINGKRKKR
jgi:hypothetical protein